VPTIRNGPRRRYPIAPRTVFRPRDVLSEGVSRTALSRLVSSGDVERVGRGLYMPRTAKVTAHHSLVEAIKRVPRGVVCLLSALRFHGMTTQNPHEIWIAIDVKARKPAVGALPLRIVRFSAALLTFGIETHALEGTQVSITSRERTVADCFRYRNKVGVDVAIEALREFLGKRGRSVDALMEAAEQARVARVIRPYLEALA
jgi:predicted transcriptional regulator of viral defense system